MLERRLAALDAQGKARAADANRVAVELRELDAAAAKAHAAGQVREGKLQSLLAKLETLRLEKADRLDLAAVSARVGALENQRAYEDGAGLSMGDVKARLEAMERAAAELRVRTILEERVQALAESKGDAAALGAQLAATRDALKTAVQEVRLY